MNCALPHTKGFFFLLRGYKAFMDWEKGEGEPFPYCVFGAACSEVEIDCLTGAHRVSPGESRPARVRLLGREPARRQPLRATL